MKIKWSGIGIVTGRGKVGGTVAARNKGGAYVRNFVVPTNPQTTAQMFVRAAFSFIAQAWRGLTSDARRAWNGATERFPKTDIFGDRQILSGFNLFMSLNATLRTLGLPLITVPPEPASVFGFTAFSDPLFNASEFRVQVTDPVSVPEGQAVLVYASAPTSPGKNTVGNDFRLITFISEFDAASIDLIDAYTSVFGVPVTGTKIFVRFVPVSATTGQQGSPIEISAIV